MTQIEGKMAAKITTMRRWRDYLGLSQDEAAQALGVSRRTYQRAEQNGPDVTLSLAMRALALPKVLGENVHLNYPWE